MRLLFLRVAAMSHVQPMAAYGCRKTLFQQYANLPPFRLAGGLFQLPRQ